MHNSKPFMSRYMNVAILAAALTGSGSASGVLLTVDPGEAGGPSNEPLIDDQLLTAADRALDVVFPDMKYVDVTTYGFTDYSGPPINLAAFWLTDELGQEIDGTRTTGNIFSGVTRTLTDPVTAYDIHFEFDLVDARDAVFDVVANGTVGVSAVPAPTTTALLAIGLLGLGYARRRRAPC